VINSSEPSWPSDSGLGIGTLWPGIQIRHLAALLALAQEGSFGRAAERLGYTQSALSQQIAALERSVGQQLVEPLIGQRRWTGSGGMTDVAVSDRGRLAEGRILRGPCIAQEPSATVCPKLGWTSVTNTVGTAIATPARGGGG
jgi:hypothetical protein